MSNRVKKAKFAMMGGSALLLGLLANVSGAQQLLLRDAIYLYGQSVPSYYYKEIVGYHCDVLELVLDVESGYTDLQMYEGANRYVYPDRILDYHEMFAYALYTQTVTYKSFMLTDNKVTQAAQNTTAGKVTAFGYCYSTQPDAYVFQYDSQTNQCARTSGSISCPANGNWVY